MELERLFRFNEWANEETLRSLERAEPAPDRAMRWMAHIAAAETLWLARLRGSTESIEVWPALSLSEIAERLRGNAQQFATLVASAPDESREITYLNSKGESWTSNVGDVLQHVVMHGVHHRAQIASELSAAGFAPAYVDFIHATRTGQI